MRAAGDILLVACYEMGHQPLAVAWPAAFLERAGYAPAVLDVSVEPLDVDTIRRARLVAISVPMHTALRLGVRVAARVRELNPAATLVFYGLYAALNAEYIHEVIDHAEAYVRGHVHTNGIENFWSLLKRAIKGTYVNVEPFHLFRYLDEQTFRYNARKTTDGKRFERVTASIVGKRVTYRELTRSATTPA